MLNTILIIIGAALIIYVSSGLFEFFGIPFKYYGVYMLWFIVLLKFSIILPERVGKVFY